MAEICERADVARQTFFNHFATKQDLVVEMARRGHEFFLEALETARREGSDHGRAPRALLRPELHEAAVAVGPMHQDLVAEVTRAVYGEGRRGQVGSPCDRGVEKLLRLGRTQGDVSRRHALEDQAALVLGALQASFFEWTQRSDFPIALRARAWRACWPTCWRPDPTAP